MLKRTARKGKVQVMSFASKFNKSRKFSINTTGFSYKSLADLFNENGADCVYTIYAIYINTKSKFGDAPVVATADYFVNFPKHMIEDAQEILSDADAISDINAGKVGFKIYQYHDNKHNRDCFGVDWVDVEA